MKNDASPGGFVDPLDNFINLEEVVKQNNKKSLPLVIAYSLFTYLFLTLSIIVYMSNSNLIFLSIVFLLITQRHIQTQVHDISHFFFTRNKQHNDLIGDFLFAGFIGMKISNYRAIHQKHHKYNGGDNDPEYFSYNDVKNYGGYWQFIFSYVIGAEAIKLIKKYYFPSNKNKTVLKIRLKSVFHVLFCQFLLLMLFYTYEITFFYLIWVYLAVTLNPLLSRLRFLVEHPSDQNITRTTASTFIEKVFFAPHNFNYHFEHHWFPSVPPYNLKKIHNQIRNTKYFDKHPSTLNKYFISEIPKAKYT